MRTIKFRALRKDCEGFAYGYLTQYQGKLYISNEVIEHPTHADPSGTWIYTEHEVGHESVGQFTGLTDKNGKEIYEGDIIKGTFTPTPPANYHGSWPNTYDVLCEVFWHGTGLCAKNLNKGKASKAWVHKSFYSIDAIEVIGNIHDNPELL